MMLTALLMSATPAHAWTLAGWAWDSNEFPVEWYLSDYVTPELGADYEEEVSQLGASIWAEQAPCAGTSDQYMGIREGHWESGPSASDLVNTVYFDDPSAVNGETALGVTYTSFGGAYFPIEEPSGDISYIFEAYDSDIVFSEWAEWASTEDIAAGNCNSEFSIEGVATHEFGHFWGMGHSCEQEDVEAGLCTELAWYDATMFWTGGACDLTQANLADDDIQGITALYGPYASFSTDSETSGGVPLEVCFDLQTKTGDYEGLEVEWSFGDGATSTEFTPCHSYETQGQFTVFVSITGTDESCGSYSFDQREPAFVTVCEPPHAGDGFTGTFTYEYVEGTTYQMVNQADLSVYGCIDQVAWDVFKDGQKVQSISAWAPKIDFGEKGSYEVVLNLGGPGGIAADSLTIDVGTDGVGGCSAVPGAAAGLFGLLAGLGAAVRRRRQH